MEKKKKLGGKNKAYPETAAEQVRGKKKTRLEDGGGGLRGGTWRVNEHVSAKEPRSPRRTLLEHAAHASLAKLNKSKM